MTLESRTREAVKTELEPLVDTYGTVDIQRETVTNDTDFFEEGRKLADEGWLGDAGAWVENDDGEVLLVRYRDDPDTWATPAGANDPDEGLEETARFAVRATTGVDCDLTGLYYALWKTIVHAADTDERIHMLTVQFEARTEGDSEPTVTHEEVLEARWFDTLPDNLHDLPARKASADAE